MGNPRFTPRQLEAFVAAAELSNFSQAASRLNLSSSAVSNLINELEAALGFALFERTTRKVVLTPDGREFLPSALAVLRQIRVAGLAATDVRNRSKDVVRVGAPLALASAILPALVAEHRKTDPRTLVRIIDTGVEWLADRVATGEIDVAVGPDRQVSADVVRVSLFPVPWTVWCSPTHPLAAFEMLRWEDLAGYDFYAAGRDHEHSVRPRLAGHPAALAVEPVQVVDNMTTALGIAAAGLGYTCSPAYTRVLAEPMGLVMRPLVDPQIIREMSLYLPANRTLSAAAVSFADRVRGLAAGDVAAQGRTHAADPVQRERSA